MTWTRVPDLALARSHPAVAALDGRIYAIGGGGPGFASLDSVEVFDPTTGRWSASRPMPTRRSGAMAVPLGDRIAVIGGGFKKPDGKFTFLRTVEFYEPAADRWSLGPDMLQPHDYPACAVLDDWIYIVGGHHPDATEGGPQTDPGFAFAERWRPGDAAWHETAPLPTPRFAAAALALHGRVAVAGGVAFTPDGFCEYDRVELYDPRRNAWERAAWSLPWAAAAHGVAVLDGRLYLIGGWAADRSVMASVRAWRDD